MDRIQHKCIDVRGVKLHVAEIGTGPRVVVFIHGFPEAWYSWRHQMLTLAAAGFRTIAPDLRGYGLSEPHPEPEKASFNDFVEDTLTILDYFHIDKAFLIGKDFGSWPAYLLSILHPERISGIVSLGVPFFVPKPNRYQGLPEGFYIFRWKEPGRAEADFGRFDVKTVWRRIYILFSRSEIPIADQNKEIMDMVDPSSPPPPWLTIEDLANYAMLYQKSGFDSPMRVPYYKLKHEDFTVNNPKVEVPVLLIMGGKDYFIKFPGIEDYITSGEVNKYMDNLETRFVPDGNHFIQEQLPDQVNEFIVTFLNRLSDQDQASTNA
ncbi:bifunctional epoxide hydrolase 2-like [Pistacia vera]|uniref:bifunctional epoxide hydrolase 2-like n=1 Tax=Pistacia vera TaxID=55513 RepID=UPI0012637C43|nr:bifunctional epoxide hydrolase 2-like [Pistacia vera]